MASERLITGTATVVFGVLSVALWGDYLSHSREVYGERDAAQSQLTEIDRQMASAQSLDEIAQLDSDRTDAESRYQQAEQRIEDMDGWHAIQWKVKNSLRLGAPAAAVLFAAFTLLATLQPLKP